MFIEANTHFRLIASSSYCNGTQKRIGVTFDLQKEQLRTNGIIITNINFCLLLTKFLQLLSLAIFTTSSLFNLLAVPSLHLLSLSLACQPFPWKSQIAHLDMHHFVFGINFQIHSVSLTILVSIHLFIHLSTHLCHHPHCCHPSLFHSRLKTYFFNKSYPL